MREKELAFVGFILHLGYIENKNAGTEKDKITLTKDTRV